MVRGGRRLGRMRVSRDSVSVLIDPRREKEKRKAERRVTGLRRRGGGVGGRFLDRNGTVPWMDCGLGSVRAVSKPWFSSGERGREGTR